MRNLLLAVLLGMASFSTAVAGESESSTERIDMKGPPFWMSSYDEFNDLQPFQKEFYLEKLAPQLAKVPSLKKLTPGKLKDASEWYQDWGDIRRKLYVACSGKSLEKTCEDIAEIRIETLDLLANRKEENRKALENKSLKSNKSK